MVVLTSSAAMTSCRVLYIGSAVPTETAMGLEAIQQPLRERFPIDETKIEGIDAIVSISNSCIQMQYLSDSDQVIQFPIASLSLCAAVRCVSTVNASTGEKTARFVSLNDPAAGGDNSHRPAIFAAVTRRTQGRKVLECHGFICSSPREALNLVKSASIAGKNHKQNAEQKSQLSPRMSNGIPQSQSSGDNSPGVVRVAVENGTFNRLSTTSRQSDNIQANGSAMRLIPGEPVAQRINAGPEFFEPVSTQGYFYSSSKSEVRKYNIEKRFNQENKENYETQSEIPHRIHNDSDIPAPPPSEPPLRPVQQQAYQSQPIYVPYRPQFVRAPMAPMPPPMRPVFYGPPPPPMFVRPRFFSPPPPRLRPYPFMMPPPPMMRPGMPPPMMAPPIFVRRPRRASHSGSRSRSSSSAGSRGSRSKSPKPDVNDTENTEPKIPNGDADSSSDESKIRRRPSTPPTDYANNRGGQRMSRRDTYEVRYGVMPPPPQRYHQDMYVYPPANGGYTPFSMYNPHARSRSVPPFTRDRSKSPNKRGKGKKSKKSKKHKSKKIPKSRYYVGNYPNGYPKQDAGPPPPRPRSDISTESFAGYHSDLPRRTRPAESSSGYQFYPPRDFRRDENQFLNERRFGKSIIEETRRSRDSKAYPTAYELNESMHKPPGGSLRESRLRNDDVDFSMY